MCNIKPAGLALGMIRRSLKIILIFSRSTLAPTAAPAAGGLWLWAAADIYLHHLHREGEQYRVGVSDFVVQEFPMQAESPASQPVWLYGSFGLLQRCTLEPKSVLK